ncbi:MbtH family protein [Nocardia sp. bgisy118]|uniref:MbtH family protein n=1 Tax=Nocardia sp. bgisy118 TaxID=3413786 RepID=UPI003F4A3A3E
MDVQFDVVCNSEEQYSTWRADDSVPAGWSRTGFRGTKSECLAHIEKIWIDMRPLSLRMADTPPSV